jgi:hypothetical protein
MPHRVQQFRLRSLTGLFLVSGFSLIVWLTIAYGVGLFQHSHAACDKAAHAASQACQQANR